MLTTILESPVEKENGRERKGLNQMEDIKRVDMDHEQLEIRVVF